MNEEFDWSKPPKWTTIVFLQIVAAGLILLIFALFHHVIPRKGQEDVVNTMPTAAPVESATPAQTDYPASLTPSPEETVSPTQTVYAPDDFSAAFPNYDTGVNAAYSYQSDNLRIAITHEYTAETSYYWADVWVRTLSEFRTAFAHNEFGTNIIDWPLNIANEAGAIFAVTGDYCGARNDGVVIRNGSRYRSSVISDVCVILADGTMQTYKKDGFNLDALTSTGIWQAWSFGPPLLSDGQAIPEFTDPIRVANPRTAIGYYAPGHYAFCVVDGRQEGSAGMTLTELSALFADKGCKAAFNLDGGQTSAMIFQGQVINNPSDGGRRCSDIICFGGMHG